MASRVINIKIDDVEFQAEMTRLQSVLKPEQFNTCMRRVFSRTGKHVKQILKTDLPKEYEVRPGQVGSAVGGASISGGGVGVGCTIPVRGTRGSIGGRYRASGGAHGWNSLRRKYRVKAKIVKAGQSVLPQNLPGNYGGNPPFRNFDAPGLNGLAYTRETKDRFPIRKVEGIAIPQMPTTRSEPDVQKDVRDFMFKRMEHEFQQMIKSGK